MWLYIAGIASTDMRDKLHRMYFVTFFKFMRLNIIKKNKYQRKALNHSIRENCISFKGGINNPKRLSNHLV